MTSFRTEHEPANSNAIRLQFRDERHGEQSLSFAEVLALWASDDAFCKVFSRALAEIPFDAFFWETPPLSAATADQPFACVLTPAPALAGKTADPRPFARQFAAEAGPVIAFQNLGGDASLVVPRDLGADYGHLADFLRTAPSGQVRQLWRSVAKTAETWRRQDRKCWISTSGLGVAWLHVRIDARPKYYSYAPYRAM